MQRRLGSLFPSLWFWRTLRLVRLPLGQRDLIRHHDPRIHDLWRVARLQDVQPVVLDGLDGHLLGKFVRFPGAQGWQ